MAERLYRLGKWCYEHFWRVIAAWVAILALGGVGAATLAGTTTDSFTLDGLESTQAFDLIKERTPQATTDGATAQVVIQAPEGRGLATRVNQELVATALDAAKTDHVASVTDPFTSGTVSQDGRTAYSTVTYDRPATELSSADEKAVEEATSTLEAGGLSAVVGGDAFPEAGHGASAEIIGLGIALVILLITFGSLLAAGMPLITAVIGVGIGITGITTLSGFVELSSVTSALGAMLGLAVGIDYALFIMSRFRQESAKGRTLPDAAGLAVGTAGSAVVFAGLTVVIALAGLSITGIGFLTEMGLGGAAMIAVAVLIALTLLPALLGLGGRRVAARPHRARTAPGSSHEGRDEDEGQARHAGHEGHDGHAHPHGAKTTLGERWGNLMVRFRWPVLIGGLALAAVMAIPVASIQLALPDNGTAPADTGQRQAFDLISENFGEGANGPLSVVVDTQGAADPIATVTAYTEAAEGVETDVAALVPPLTDPNDPAQVEALRQQLQAVGFAAITIVPGSGPSDEATKQLVDDLRAAFADVRPEAGGQALVTGQTAVGVDIAEKISEVFPRYLVVVVGLAIFLLIMVFRSILVPVKAAVGFLISLGISLGATVAIVQWGWLADLLGFDATGPVLFILPLLLTGILFGLAMDYEVFLVTRMREEHVHGADARTAIVSGIRHNSLVVVAAALIMIGVFGGFAGGTEVIIKSLGLALAIGVVADAFLVRMMLVPALMAIAGPKMWWLPSWMERAVPTVDIEGEGLTTRLDEAQHGRADASERGPSTPRSDEAASLRGLS